MKFKDRITNIKLDSNLILILLTIISIIFTLIIWHYPTLPPEKIGLNPNIKLYPILVSQENLIFLENGNKSLQLDEIEYLDTLKYKNQDNIFNLKLIKTDPSKRYVVVLLADPNNIVRFINIPINENLKYESDVKKLEMQEISNDKYIRIKIPSLDGLSIYGEWHLNIYVYDNNKELTSVISEPLDISISKGWFQ